MPGPNLKKTLHSSAQLKSMEKHWACRVRFIFKDDIFDLGVRNTGELLWALFPDVIHDFIPRKTWLLSDLENQSHVQTLNSGKPNIDPAFEVGIALAKANLHDSNDSLDVIIGTMTDQRVGLSLAGTAVMVELDGPTVLTDERLAEFGW
jgi:hypothetical protein